MSDARPSSAPCCPGLTLGDKLGSGTYATVFKALTNGPSSNGVRETYAVKCIERSKVNAHKVSVDNLMSEIQILKKVTHRHIVQLVDFRWDNTYIYLILEYCGGGDLSLFIRQQRALPENMARKFLRQLASAMNYLRSRNIAHMDLKPQNILLLYASSPIILKLADFGFAQHMTSYGDAGSSLRGSLLYMAPEMVIRGAYDARVDLWSIGVILYECLFGHAPFTSKGIPELMSQICAETPVEIPECNLSQNCVSLLQGLLRRNPNHRFTFEEFFNHPFVDIDHVPSAESVGKANAFLEEAVSADRNGHIAIALKLYAHALDYLVPALQFEQSQSGRDRIKLKINQYLRRAEELKSTIKPPIVPPRAIKSDRRVCEESQTISMDIIDAPSTSASICVTPDVDVLRLEWPDRPQVQAAITVISAAQQLHAREKWEDALSKYQLAIESMINILGTEPSDSQRRAALRNCVSNWLQKAEQIRNYIQVRDVSLSELAQTHLDIQNEEIAEEALVAQTNETKSQCSIQ